MQNVSNRPWVIRTAHASLITHTARWECRGVILWKLVHYSFCSCQRGNTATREDAKSVTYDKFLHGFTNDGQKDRHLPCGTCPSCRNELHRVTDASLDNIHIITWGHKTIYKNNSTDTHHSRVDSNQGRDNSLKITFSLTGIHPIRTTLSPFLKISLSLRGNAPVCSIVLSQGFCMVSTTLVTLSFTIAN